MASPPLNGDGNISSTASHHGDVLPRPKDCKQCVHTAAVCYMEAQIDWQRVGVTGRWAGAVHTGQDGAVGGLCCRNTGMLPAVPILPRTGNLGEPGMASPWRNSMLDEAES